jgi:nanoRNase/pAp phosphatase (c-di-AMP/oligoRNAs hydrolase)
MTVESLKKKFLEFLEKNSNKKFAISTHAKADIDAIASAYALCSAFPNSTLFVPDELNMAATGLAEKLGIKFKILRGMKDADRKKFDGLAVADTSAYALIKDAKDWNVVAIIDHHRADGRDMKAPNEFFDETSPSCAELVAELLPEIKDKKVAFALACGIISDTARFKNGKRKTFAMFSNLMEIAEVEYKELLEISEFEPPADVKVAVMKACQRMQYVVVGNYVVVTSEVSSGESDAAAFLSDMADVVFVSSFKEKEQEVRISSRARKHVTVPLNEVMKQVAVSYGGNGGGHGKAAGAAIPKSGSYVDIQEILKKCVEVFSSKLK